MLWINGGKGDQLGIVQETYIWPYEQMEHAQLIIRLGNKSHKFIWDFHIQMDHLISATWLNLVIVNKTLENMLNLGRFHSDWPQNKTERKRKES